MLCIDGEGILTVIETRLARNPQIRREVVGQIMEYVGPVSKWRAQDVVELSDRYFQSENAPDEQCIRAMKILKSFFSLFIEHMV